MVWSNQEPTSIVIPPGATTGQRIIIDQTGINAYDVNGNLSISESTSVTGFPQILVGNKANDLAQIQLTQNPGGGAFFNFIFNDIGNELNNAIISAATSNEGNNNKAGQLRITGPRFSTASGGSKSDVIVLINSGNKGATQYSSFAIQTTDIAGNGFHQQFYIDDTQIIIGDSQNTAGTVTVNNAGVEITNSGSNSALTVNSNGVIIGAAADPVKSYYECVNLNSAQVIPAGANTQCTNFNSTDLESDYGSGFNLVTGVWTCPVTAKYFVDFALQFQTWISNSRLRTSMKYVPIATGVSADFAANDNTPQFQQQSVYKMFRFQVGDQLTFFINQSSTANRSPTADNRSIITIGIIP